jgi:ferric-dicitrate binding protein FerR (iron transport regulator)
LVMLDHTRLEDAVTEMNRYSRMQLAVAGGDAGTRISGVFRAGESVDFAEAISRAYGLPFQKVSNRIIISSSPSPPVP